MSIHGIHKDNTIRRAIKPRPNHYKDMFIHSKWPGL